MYAVILAGGSGTRLWPLSRRNNPKQNLKLLDNKKSLFQETVERVLTVVPEERIIIVVHKDQKAGIESQLKSLGIEKAVLMREPAARNTAPAVGLAAWYIEKVDGDDAIMAVLPADHLVTSKEEFAGLFNQARQSAEHYGMVAFGIRPTYPETGYGYINCGESLDQWTYRVQQFVEKPDFDQACLYLKDPRFLWNSGMFVFKVGDLTGQYRRFLPDLSDSLDSLDYREYSNLEDIYMSIESISIDYGILEKSDRVTVIPTDLGWSDVGSWESLYKIFPKDIHGNHIRGEVISLDTHSSLIYSQTRLIGTVGVENLIIIDTEDALLICSREKSQEVKKIVEEIKKNTLLENQINSVGDRPSEVYNKWLNSRVIDPDTRQELLNIKDDRDSIIDRFGTELSFGTGGMRGIIGAGSNRINRYVIRKAAQGLADYLRNRYRETQKIKVAIAYDTRYYSGEFAEETALVLSANGIEALVFEEVRPTPLLSFATRELGCCAGVVITASHNPPNYNGYKVYGPDGAQMVSPMSDELSKAISQVDIFDGVHTIPMEEAVDKGLFKYIGSELDVLYKEKVRSLSITETESNLKVVFTPLHGTGSCFIPTLLGETGYIDLYTVEEQMSPDPAFSTVQVPNPEDPETFTLGLKMAERLNADLVLATDPDCDRIGCAARDKNGVYRFLNGNQIGALLLEYILGRLSEKGDLPADGVVIKTIVTGELGEAIAAFYGIRTMETLTGFKYIGEKIKQFEETGSCHFLFGYEESYGFLAGTFVRDKDANIAAFLIAEMAAYYKQKGQDLHEVLEGLYRRHGYYKEDLLSLNLGDKALEAKLMDSFNKEFPEVDCMTAVEKRDYSCKKCYDLTNGSERALDLPDSRVLYYKFDDNSWFCVRPSGTEPKIKIYLSVVGKSNEEADQKLESLKKAILSKAC